MEARRGPLEVVAVTGSDSWKYLKIFSSNSNFINTHELRKAEESLPKKGKELVEAI